MPEPKIVELELLETITLKVPRYCHLQIEDEKIEFNGDPQKDTRLLTIRVCSKRD